MARLHRTRRIRNERWYSVWDQWYLARKSTSSIALSAVTHDGFRRTWVVPGLVARVHIPLGLTQNDWTPIGRAAGTVGVILATAFAFRGSVVVFWVFGLLMMLCGISSFYTRSPIPTIRERVKALRERTSLGREMQCLSAITPSMVALTERLREQRTHWMNWRRKSSHSFNSFAFEAISWIPKLWGATTLALLAVMATLKFGPTFSKYLLLHMAVSMPLFYSPPHFARLFYSRAIKRYTSGHCPDCNYALVGIPNAIDPPLLNGMHTGPARCPECGTHWPLVPPPIPVR